MADPGTRLAESVDDFVAWSAKLNRRDYGTALQRAAALAVARAVADRLAAAGVQTAAELTGEWADDVVGTARRGDLPVAVLSTAAAKMAREFLVWVRAPVLLELAITLPPTERRRMAAPGATVSGTGGAISGPRAGTAQFTYWYAFHTPQAGDPRLLTPEHAEAFRAAGGTELTTARVFSTYLASRVPELAQLRRALRVRWGAPPEESPTDPTPSEGTQTKLTWLDVHLLRWLANRKLSPDGMNEDHFAQLRAHVGALDLNGYDRMAIDTMVRELFAVARTTAGAVPPSSPPAPGWSGRARTLFRALADGPEADPGIGVRLLAVLAGPPPEGDGGHPDPHPRIYTVPPLAEALRTSRERMRACMQRLRDWVEAVEIQAPHYLLTASRRRLVHALEALTVGHHAGFRTAATLVSEQLLPILRSPPPTGKRTVGNERLPPLVRVLMERPEGVLQLQVAGELEVTSATIGNWGRDLVSRGLVIGHEGRHGMHYWLLPGLAQAAKALAGDEVGYGPPVYDLRPLAALLRLPSALDPTLDVDPYAVIIGHPAAHAVWRDAGFLDAGGLTEAGARFLTGLRIAAATIGERRAITVAGEVADALATPGVLEVLDHLLVGSGDPAFPGSSLETLRELPGWTDSAEAALNGDAGSRLVSVTAGRYTLASAAAATLVAAIRDGVDPPGASLSALAGVAEPSGGGRQEIDFC